MAERLRLTVACGDYEIVRALKEGTVKADGIDLVMLTGMGPRERHWRMARKAEFDVCEANVGAYFMERDQGEAAHRDPGLPAPALSPRLSVRQRRCRHSRAEGPHRQEGRRHEFPAGLQYLDARHPGGGIRAPAPAGDLGGRAQRGRRLHAPEGSAHRDDRSRQEARRDAGGRRNPGHAVAGSAEAVPRRATSGSCGCFRLQGHRARLFPQDRHLSDHACHHHQAGDRRQVSLGADQPGEGLRGGEEHRLSPDRQSAHGADRLGADRAGGAGGGARPRPLGLWPDRRPTARISRRCCATPTSRA